MKTGEFFDAIKRIRPDIRVLTLGFCWEEIEETCDLANDIWRDNDPRLNMKRFEHAIEQAVLHVYTRSYAARTLH
jgi:hypothetical protein